MNKKFLVLVAAAVFGAQPLMIATMGGFLKIV
jgi:hypothetical protein